MSIFKPFDPDHSVGRCSCGRHATQGEHNAEQARMLQQRATGAEKLTDDVIEEAVLRAMSPQDALRRNFLRAIGVNTARAAIASVLPIGAMQAIAQEKGALKKKDLKIGFIAITCAAPLIMADPLGFYRKQGLSVSLNKTAGWALIRDKMINRESAHVRCLRPSLSWVRPV